MRYLIVVAVVLLSGCTTMGKLSCHINDGGLSIRTCKAMWELDYALRHQKMTKAEKQRRLDDFAAMVEAGKPAPEVKP